MKCTTNNSLMRFGCPCWQSLAWRLTSVLEPSLREYTGSHYDLKERACENATHRCVCNCPGACGKSMLWWALPTLPGRCSTACSGLVKYIMHLSTHTHTHAHTLTDTSCQGWFLDWAVLPVGRADWQSRPARPIRWREREQPFFLPFTKRMTHKERAVKCRK